MHAFFSFKEKKIIVLKKCLLNYPPRFIATLLLMFGEKFGQLSKNGSQ
jgi:hypothetical protein